MEQSSIATRYAKAFFDLAKDKNLIPELKQDMESIAEISKVSDDFILLLESPIINTQKKKDTISAIFEGKVNQNTLNFLYLILDNNREINIPSISREFLTLVREDQNIISATFTTATKMSDEVIAKVKRKLEEKYQSTIELKDTINPDIIGGFVLRVKDQQYDSSIATKLKKVKKELLKTELK